MLHHTVNIAEMRQRRKGNLEARGVRSLQILVALWAHRAFDPSTGLPFRAIARTLDARPLITPLPFRPCTKIISPRWQGAGNSTPKGVMLMLLSPFPNFSAKAGKGQKAAQGAADAPVFRPCAKIGKPALTGARANQPTTKGGNAL